MSAAVGTPVEGGWCTGVCSHMAMSCNSMVVPLRDKVTSPSRSWAREPPCHVYSLPRGGGGGNGEALGPESPAADHLRSWTKCFSALSLSLVICQLGTVPAEAGWQEREVL